ncbi:MAG: ferritin [Thermodesulfobacteriota bacterium]
MLSKKMEKALNDQINAEFFSAYLYLSMATHFDSISLPGFVNWMKQQTQEEMFHGMKMFNYVSDRGGRVVLQAIAQPPATWKSTLEVFQQVLEHEQKVTGLINGLVDLAIKEKDHATNNFLQWFISEQVEEESTAATLVDRLKLIGTDVSGLFVLDTELAARRFVMPAAKE